MKRLSLAVAAGVQVLLLSGCVTYKDFNEVKLVGFDSNVAKGKSVSEVVGDDCVYMFLGYQLGGAPKVSTAVSNLRTGRKSQVADIVGAGPGISSDGIRYANNVSEERTGFNAVIFGKTCIEVKGAGYL